MPELYNYKSLVPFLLATIRKTSVYSLVSKALKYTRRFMLLTRIFTYIRITVSIIEASAVLILFTAILLAVFPLILLTFIGFLIADTVNSRRILKCDDLSDTLAKKRVYVICTAGNFGENFAHELSEGAAVFILTASPQKRFITAKKERGVWYIRHTFYFKLKRKKLSKINSKIVYLM